MSQPSHPPRLFRFGVFEVDVRAGELRKHGVKVKLQDQPFQILVLLMERRGDVVTRDELRQNLWPADTFVDFDHSLNSAVNKLREALGDSADTPRYIETLPRRGYRFLLPVEEETRAASPGALDLRAAQRAEPAGRAPRAPAFEARVALPGWLFAAAVLLVLVVVVAANWERVRTRFRALSGSQRIESLAVLPLENLSGDPEQEYFADGMTDALITNLARVRGLRRVISRTSVIPYKDTRKRLPQIAGELNVDGIIEGSVLRSGNQVRISVQLLHGPSDRHLWAREYERDLSDIVTLQREVAHAIVEEIRVQLTPEEKSQLTGTRPVNPEAYDAYVKGRYFWNKRSAEGLQKSIEYFQQAIALDPGYALAHAGLADTYNALSFFSLMPPKEASPRAKKAALRAIELDDTLAEAHAALADVAFHYDWDWQAAERGFRRANELNPNYATAHQWYGAYLALMGRVAESQAEFERAESLDPHSLLIIADATSVFYYSRRYDEALAQCRKSLELDPNYPLGHLWCGRAYLQKGMHPEAIAAFSKAVELQPGFVLGAGLRAHAQGVAGNRAEARRRIGQLLGQSQRVYVSPALISLAYWGVGDRAQALDWAERAYRERDGLLTRLKMDPALDEFRKDPQFRDLMRRIGLDAPAASPAQVPR